MQALRLQHTTLFACLGLYAGSRLRWWFFEGEIRWHHNVTARVCVLRMEVGTLVNRCTSTSNRPESAQCRQTRYCTTHASGNPPLRSSSIVVPGCPERQQSPPSELPPCCRSILAGCPHRVGITRGCGEAREECCHCRQLDAAAIRFRRLPPRSSQLHEVQRRGEGGVLPEVPQVCHPPQRAWSQGFKDLLMTG